MRKPVVSIVGRPNVGKSSVFNKLIERKMAITEDTPGVTRDRLYGEVNWLEKSFKVIDTGGLAFDDDDEFQKGINTQVEIAIQESDLILFIVDAMEGLNPLDEEIAQKIRKTGKKTIVAINKIDSKIAKKHIYDFYPLGFDDFVEISAEQGLGIGDLLEKIVENFDDSYYTEEDDDITKIALIGKPNVGKSSLVNKLLGEERVLVTDIPGTTRDAIDSLYKYNDRKYLIIDTAGLRRRRAIKENIERYSVIRTLSAIDRSEICILMVDAKEGISEQDSKIIGYAHDNSKAMLIVVNKWDLLEKETMTAKNFENEVRERLPFINYAPILFVSVKTGQRINKIFEMIEIIDNNYSLRIKTSVLNNIINKAVLMSPPPTDKGRRLRIYYISQISTRAPKFMISVNDPELMHFSYLRYLENQIRAHFGFEGVPLKFEIKASRRSED